MTGRRSLRAVRSQAEPVEREEREGGMLMDNFTAANQEKIWKHFQNHAAESFEGAVPRLDHLIKQIARLSKSAQPVVLNIGVGSGHFERQALARGWAIHALDPDGDSLVRLAAEGVASHQGHIEKMPLESATFDFVVASEVLEHLIVEQRESGLQEIARVLKPGGWFLGTVPYEENLAAGQTVCPECGVVFHRWGHFTTFTRDDIVPTSCRHISKTSGSAAPPSSPFRGGSGAISSRWYD